MQRLNTVFLGIIAAVALGAAVVWWMNQPSAEERRWTDLERSTQRLRDAVDRYDGAVRSAAGD